jgi:hypothetical protein
MKQTAVEWLINNLHYLHSTKWNDILEQAKEMEKQQNMQFTVDWYNQWIKENPKSIINYYNETYIGNK